MRVHQIIFLAFIAAVVVAGFIKVPRKMVGGVVGGILGILIPFLYAQFYVWRGGDPTAAGALFILCFVTVPLGIAIGVIVAGRVFKRAG
jgi:hypothetical protein